MNFDDSLTYTGYFFLIINTLLFLISYNQKDKALKYFIMYLILCLFIQLTSNTLNSIKIHNLFLSHYFFIGQFVFLSLFFNTLFEYNKKVVLFFIILIPSLFIYHYNKNPISYSKFNISEIAITSIPLLVFSFIFFIKSFDTIKSKKFIYFNSGFFIYTASSTLLFTTGNIGTKELKEYIWYLNSFLYLVFQILIFVEWYKNFRKPIFSIKSKS